MPSDFTENVLVEVPAIHLFEDLGWASISAKDEVLGPNGTLGRETKSEVILVARLRIALEKLNPKLPADATTSAIDEVMRDRSAMSLAAANREVWELLRDGVKVSVPDLERGGQKIERVRLAGRGESLSGWLVDSGK
jgi:type I restriction enzyme R subunit